MKLSIVNYTVHYQKESKPLLKNFSFDCASSGLYLIHGANGAGKSTLFSSIQGSSLPASITGTITIDGKTFNFGDHAYKVYAQKYVGLVPQKYDELLAPQYTVRENLSAALLPELPFVIRGMQPVAIPGVLSESGIPLDTPIESLSGGQRQITAIMMALQKSKKILLLDEPTATLDPFNTALVMNFLARLHTEAGILIIMICHDHDLKDYTENEPIIVK